MMTNLIAAAGVLIVIMLIFIFILFKHIIKRMDENAKKYFVNKMEDYDYILEEKQSKLEEIQNEIEKVEAKNRNILGKNTQEKDEIKKEEDTIEKREFINTTNQNIKYNLDVPDYRETQFFNNYKEVRKIFTINNEKIIKDFIAEHKNSKEEKEYKALKKLRQKFDETSIYGCLTLNPNDQIEVLNEILTENEKILVDFNQLTKDKNFNIKKFIELVENKMEQIEPTIYIYTNLSDNNYNEINKNIITKKYSNMSEGIIIKYRNKIYDYSI